MRVKGTQDKVPEGFIRIKNIGCAWPVLIQWLSGNLWTRQSQLDSWPGHLPELPA